MSFPANTSSGGLSLWDISNEGITGHYQSGATGDLSGARESGVSGLRLYVDQDAMDGDLIRGLRSRGVDVLTAADADMIRRKDEEHLSLATAMPVSYISVS